MSTVPELRIGELARRVGLSPEVLRAWERRYGLLQPSRSVGGFRLYSRADELRIQRMQHELARGLSPAQAARATLSADEEQAPPAAPVVDFDGLRRDLGDALERYDDAAANTLLDELIAQFTLDAVLEGVILPLLRDIGVRWQRGELSIGQEHFASNVVRGRLVALSRGWSRGVGPLAVLACPPGERHDIPLVAFGLALNRYGWRITFLGADTPVDAVAAAAEPAAVVVLSSRDESLFAAVADEIAALTARVPVALAGPGATEEAAARTGARLVRAGPLEAARELALAA